MIYQLFEKTIETIKNPNPDQKALHDLTDTIIHKVTTSNATESSLRLIKYLLFRLRRNNKLYTFFSDTTHEHLSSCFKKDPSNFTSTFLYSLSVYEQSSETYHLEKMTYSAWRFKKLADEAVKECKSNG